MIGAPTEPAGDQVVEPRHARTRRAPEEQFCDLYTQRHATHLGMWIFLGSETLLFAGLFALYVAYRIMYGHGFALALEHNNQVIGTVNTLILITSSFVVAMALHEIRAGRPRRVVPLLSLTLLMGLAFLVLKGIEYSQHFDEGIFPGSLYRDPRLAGHGVVLFFTLYFFMTGLHAIHVIGGMLALFFIALVHHRRPYTVEEHQPIELGALYWHLVDAVWIFLWPMFYLIR